MDFKDSLKKLNSSAEFKKWQKEHQDAFLCYGFIMPDSNVLLEWQFGYYDVKKDKVTSFSVGKNIEINPETEIFREDKVLELVPEKVSVSYDDALKAAYILQQKNYPMHSPDKKIILIQNLELGQVWNITFITKSFKTINVKIDSSSGKVLKHELVDFFRIDK